LAQLGIEHIPAFSPEARGRSERAFRTPQDRLPQELAVAGITSIAAADRYLREVFVPAYNARLAVAPEQPGSAFVAIGDLDLDQILCVEERQSLPRRRPGSATTTPCCGAVAGCRSGPRRCGRTVSRPKSKCASTSTLSIFHGPRCIARYRPKGQLIALAA
jgi:hypothetical protein